ncbi:hypothetical protein ACH5Y9_20715 [Methylomonas sp. BW4-1]|uniref:hypothetical protein n=1 Tax=Methylomonas sp. BW4-1 TaxID=3376685 RepID=UPI004043395A
MDRISIWKNIVIAVLIVYPFGMQWLADLDQARGLLWFYLHQLYYVPVAWIGPPLVVPDSEVGFWVQPSGRMLAAVLYLALVMLGKLSWNLRKRKIS